LVKRAVAIAAVALIPSLAIAGGAGAAGGHSQTATASCSKASLPLVQAGTLTIGTDNPAFPPWFGGGEHSKPWKFNDPATGKGYESAVAYAIARRIGFARNQVKWVVVPFATSFAPGKKKFDILLNQVSFSPQRAKNVNFSHSYYDVNQAVVTLKGKPISSVKTIAGLKPFKLGAPIGTTSFEVITKRVKPDQQAAVFDTLNDGVNALRNGTIDGLVVDLPTGFFVTAAQVKNSKIVGQFPAVGAGEHFGVVSGKGNPVTACVNQALVKLRADGTLRRLERTWLGAGAGAPFLK